MGDDKEPHAQMEKVLYVVAGCDRPHLTSHDARECEFAAGPVREVVFVPKPTKVYVVTDGAYADMSIEAVTLFEGVAEYLVTKKVGDQYEEMELTKVPPTFKPKLTMVYQRWMEQRRDFGELSDNPLLPEGDRALAYKWVEVLREHEDIKETFVPVGGDKELECRWSSRAHPSTQGQKEGISIYASGTDFDKVREAYNKIKDEHTRKWEGGE